MIQWNGQQVLDEIGHRIDQQANEIGKTFVRVANTYVPRRTGALARTIDDTYDNSTHTIQFIAGSPTVNYAIFVEFGTRYTMAHPYIRPALNTVGTIWGFNTEMVFAGTARTDTELLARGPGYLAGKGLTAGQKRHVKYNLKPVSERHHVGNVTRAKLRVRHGY